MLAPTPERSVTADVLIDELDRLAMQRGYLTVLRCDNGPELALRRDRQRALARSLCGPAWWRTGVVA